MPVNFPKTGHMTEQTAEIAARDLAARLAGRKVETAELSARCVLDMGDRGAYMAADPVRPPRNRIPTVSEGRRWLYAAELAAAASALGVHGATLLAYPDGHLAEVALEELVARIAEEAGDAELLLAFDVGGITAHPDHIRATEGALAFGTDRRLPVLGWALPEKVAAQLNAELGTSFVGRRPGELDLIVAVDRARQRMAIACHASQSTDNPVLWRRLALLGDAEHPPVAAPATEGPGDVSEADPSDPAAARGPHSGPRTTRSWRAPAPTGRSASMAAPLGMLGCWPCSSCWAWRSTCT